MLVIMHQLDSHIRKMLQEIQRFETLESMELEGIEIADHGGEFAPFENGGIWGMAERWQDFRVRVTVPEDWKDMVVLRQATGREGQWDASNPQFVVRVNGRVEQAFDVNHRELPLEAGKTYDILLNGYSQTPSNDCKQPPRLWLTLDHISAQLRGLYYDLAVPYEAAVLLPEDNREREITLETLSRALDILDLRDPGSEECIASAAAAREFLKTEYYEPLSQKAPVAQADAVGHTHIDVAWLWDLYQTRHKAVRSFSTVLKLMERYPEYKFMSSQAHLYNVVKQDEPEVFQRIKQRVAEGRWEPEGGMWVEADCNVTSGESLVRQFLYGQMFFTQEFGKPSRILWLPDVFGYSAALPQILKLAGIDYFMTTKISWSEYNLTPYDTFLWKGIDGSEVLTHFSPSRDYHNDNTAAGHEGLAHYTTYNADLNPSQMKGGWQRYQQKGLDDHFLVSYGFGDGGGGPTEKMLEYGRRMETPMPGVPKVNQCHARPFFEALEKRVSGDPRLPKWSGELYLEYHRGTYTAIAKNKRNNRKIELLLRDVEFWRTVAYVRTGLNYPQEALDEIWRDVLTLQFHDILPGSSIKKVYDDSDEMYAQRFGELNAMLDEAIAALSGEMAGDVIVLNSLSHVRGDVISFDAPETVKSLVAADGTVYPVQREDGICKAFVGNLAPMAVSAFAFSDREAPAHGLVVAKDGFDTPFFSGRFDSAMRITSLIEKKSGRQVVKEGQALNTIVCYENRPHNYDAWDVNIYYDRRHWDVDDVQNVEMLASGPIEAVLRVTYRYMHSTLVQDIHLYRDLPRIDFVTEVDWKEKNYMLKARFPVDVFYNEATYDIQYGNIKRPTHKNTSWDAAKFEVCGHKWADVSEDDFGATILNDCKYGHSIDENAMALTLLKSSIYPNPEADQEMHHFTYSFAPHTGDWKDAGIPNMAYDLNVPARTAKGLGNAEMQPFVAVNAENIVVEVVKRAQNGSGIVVRMYENFGRRTNVHVTPGFQWNSVELVNLLEQKLADASLDLTFHPYEIKTLLFRK